MTVRLRYPALLFLCILAGLFTLGIIALDTSDAQAGHHETDPVLDVPSDFAAVGSTDVISSTIFLPALLTDTEGPTPTPSPTPSPTPTPSSPPSDDPLTAEEKMTAVESMEGTLNAVFETDAPFEQRDLVGELDTVAQQLVNAPHVATVLVYTETLTIQTVLIDGTVVLVNNNRPPEAESNSGRMAPASGPRLVADNVPTSRRYVSTSFDGGGAVASAVGSLLAGKGYAATGLGPSLANMKNYRNLGALYLDTHGTGWTRVDKVSKNPDGSYKVEWGAPSYGFQSSTQVNAQLLNSTYKADLEAGRLVIKFVKVNGKMEAKLGITESFISTYWDLKDAIVMIHSCFGGSGPFTGEGECYGNCDKLPGTVFDPRPIRSAILGAGAKVIVSFDNYTNADIARSNILFLFDRLLGANAEQATSPPTRPFPFTDVWGEMSRRNLTTFNKPSWIGPLGITLGGNKVNMTFDAAAPNGSSTLLAPSIRYVDVSDDASQSAGKVEIYGSFGSQQGEVEVDGTQIPVTSWSKTKIEASPPWDGLGSRGYLVVKAPDDVRSNFIPFTEWRGTIRVSMDPGFGSLSALMEMDVRVRADLHKYRETINGTPQDRSQQRAYFSGASDGKSQGSGTYTSEDGTLTYLGGGTMPIIGKAQVDAYVNSGPNRGRSAAGEDQAGSLYGGFIDLDEEARTGRLCFFAIGEYTQRISGEGGSQDLTSYLTIPLGEGLEDSALGLLSCFNMTMNSDYSLRSGSRSIQIEEVTFKVEWTNFTPFAEPTDRTPS